MQSDGAANVEPSVAGVFTAHKTDESRNSGCSQTFAKYHKMVHVICIYSASWCRTGSKAAHNSP
jgi:hypothetical protein